MPDTVTRTEHIWMFGRRCDFNVYASSVALAAFQYEHDAQDNPTTRQKNQIVLHYTAGNGRAEGDISWWNFLASWHCPQTGAHSYSAPNPGQCPTHGVQLVRTSASAHYIIERAQHRLDANQPYCDVVEVVDSARTTWHGGPVNLASIGIEHTNVGWNWPAASGDPMVGTGANRRPVDHNRWIHLAEAVRDETDFQAFQEEQYRAMVMLLRSLCIKHRIPRRFLGDTTDEKMQRWWHQATTLTRSKLMRFRGILSHMNCHADKACGGPAMHRNRLFRGIIDEWWMPVESGDDVRPYYMGPFDPQTSVASFVRWGDQAWQADLFHDADPDALQSTRSYFEIDQAANYYERTETEHGGIFPVGLNRTWHGGVHMFPPAANLKIYAAASGTIVAARLGGDQPTEEDPEFGSQRFILVRHAVYLRTEEDPGGGTRIDYEQDPLYVFTLYMHVAAIANLEATDTQNPPWFNVWRRLRRQEGDDPSAVFCPDVEVSVGDWIGECGTYGGQRMMHFEVMSREELTMAPWDNAALRAFDDNDEDVLCDIDTLDGFLVDRENDGLDTGDIRAAAPGLRRVKSYHKSEWALAGPEALAPLELDDQERDALWARMSHFMWVEAAVAACPDLTDQLCDARGFMWHYHPITFMDHVNRLIQEENGEMEEADATTTNVTVEGDYLTRYVSFATGAAQDVAADNSSVQPYAVSNQDFRYHFSRNELACSAQGAHASGAIPTRTRFHVNLLDLVESVRVHFNASVAVRRSHVCSNHAGEGNAALCVLGTAEALGRHADGHAIDVRPGNVSPESCALLWTSIHTVITEEGGHDCSAAEPSRGQVPYGMQNVSVSTLAALQEKLEAGTPLTNAEAAQCVFHIELGGG